MVSGFEHPELLSADEPEACALGMLSWESPSLLGSGKAAICAGVCIDCRRGWNHNQKLKPFAGDMFVFLSKDLKRVKILVWEITGYWLCRKKLEGGRFVRPVGDNPASRQSAVTISAAELAMLLKVFKFTVRCIASTVELAEARIFYLEVVSKLTPVR